ncbi:Uncharacterized protein MLTONO_4471 [Mesorhizobium loti]|nr:Uncharacterized protein MLTONO_4471 [Mesorhizobium loti]
MNIQLPTAAPSLFKWPRVRLGEIAEHRLGKMLDKEKNTGVPRRYIRNPNIRWFDFDLSDLQEILVEEKDVHKYEIRDGDVLICEGGEAGRAALWKGNSDGIIFQKACHRVRVGPRLDAKYLIHRLFYDYHNGGLGDYYTGATIKHFTGQDLARYEFPLPPLPEQRRIAAILDKADALRRKRKRAIELLDNLMQSLFLEMFGEPTTNAKGFPLANLEDVVTAVVDCPHTTPNWAPSGKIALRTSNLTAGGWDWSDKRFVSEQEFHERSVRAYVKPGDIVLSREGTVGVAAIVQDDMEVCLGQRLVHVRLDGASIGREYLLSFLLYELSPRRISRIMVGATSTHLNLKDLRNMNVPIPPKILQDDYRNKTDKIYFLKYRAQRMMSTIDTAFLSLQHRAFSGQL